MSRELLTDQPKRNGLAAAGGEKPTVGAEGHTRDHRFVLQLQAQLTGRCVPDPSDAPNATGCEEGLPVGAECHAGYPEVVLQSQPLYTARCVPDPSGALSTGRDQRLAV